MALDHFSTLTRFGLEVNSLMVHCPFIETDTSGDADMAYIKIADTDHGELGHNGWAWVLNHPYATEDKDHPAYYEDTGVLCRRGEDYFVSFSRSYKGSRSGLHRPEEIRAFINSEQANAGNANRAEHDAIHMPEGGWRVVTD